MKTSLFTFLFLAMTTVAGAQTEFHLNDYPLGKEYSRVSLDRANEIFNTIKSSPVLEYRYTRGGCDYRAHAAYLMMKNMGIKTFKIWNFASSKVFMAGKDFNTHNLLLRVKDKMDLTTKEAYYKNCNTTIDEFVYWGYHVAPVLLVGDEAKTDTLVIDPALYDSPVDYKTWLQSQIQDGANTYHIFLEANLISFQSESQYTMNGEQCKDCTGNDIITGYFWTDEYSIEKKWIEQSLAKGRIMMEYYQKEIENWNMRMKKYAPDTIDERALQTACELAAKKKVVSTENGFTSLPKEYQDKLQGYVDEATRVLFK